MEVKPVIIHITFLVTVFGLTLTGLVLDEVFSGGKENLELNCQEGPCAMNISGLKLSTSYVFLDYNKCPQDTPAVEASALYSPDGVKLEDLIPGAVRSTSVAQFAHINVHEDGTEIIGDIGVIEGRSQLGRKCIVLGLLLQFVGIALTTFKRSVPTSVVSKFPLGVSPRDHLFRQLVNWCTLISAGFLWVSMLILSSSIPTLLAHLFREARDRCDVHFLADGSDHSDIRTMGSFVRDHSDPNGSTIILLSISIALLFSYSVALFIQTQGVSLSRMDLKPYRNRMLAWYCRLWSWKLSVLLLLTSLFVTFWVMNLTKVRGYSVNNFYWEYGSRVAQATGLSRTGTLLDFLQKFLSLVAVPESLTTATVCVWLIIPPMVASASVRPVAMLSKFAQDLALLLLIRAAIAWVTVVPTALSMMEKPECFMSPDNIAKQSRWLFILDTRQSCNDTMFGICVVLVGIPVFVIGFFLRYAGVVTGVYGRIVTGYLGFCATFACIITVISRHQYSSDIVIGACIVIIYMLTQAAAYQALFERYDKSEQSKKSLQDEIVHLLEDCANRFTMFNSAVNSLKGLALATNDLDEISLVYRSVGEALNRARAGRVMTSEPTGDGITIAPVQ